MPLQLASFLRPIGAEARGANVSDTRRSPRAARELDRERAPARRDTQPPISHVPAQSAFQLIIDKGRFISPKADELIENIL